MWPEAVEAIAAFLRASGIEGRLEELLPEAGPPAGERLHAHAFDTSGGRIVALVPAARSVDGRKLGATAGSPELRAASTADFPFVGARVFVDQSVLSAEVVWVQAGSPRHVLGLSPAQLTRVTNAQTADLLREAGTGEVDGMPRG
ncbi:MAG: hypothetical protein QOE13_2697 [Gaiellaceae bacterium]|nr:hypothetical protein [Gaiellaceae bacterium]